MSTLSVVDANDGVYFTDWTMADLWTRPDWTLWTELFYWQMILSLAILHTVSGVHQPIMIMTNIRMGWACGYRSKLSDLNWVIYYSWWPSIDWADLLDRHIPLGCIYLQLRLCINYMEFSYYILYLAMYTKWATTSRFNWYWPCALKFYFMTLKWRLPAL